ncbi:MAG: hypothetical protein ACOCG6_04785 [Candidatus Cloacimonadaceae bacterium]
MRNKIWFIVLILLCLCACKPNSSAITTAVKENIMESIPASWAGSLLGGKATSVESISVLQIGKYNKDFGYYPVKVRCIGKGEANTLFGTEPVDFDKEGDFQVYKDDYGKWKASYAGVF